VSAFEWQHLAAAWVLVFVVMLATFTGMMLAPIFGSTEGSWTSPGITIPRHDPLAADPPSYQHEREHGLRPPT
jgi:hypothetical protein